MGIHRGRLGIETSTHARSGGSRFRPSEIVVGVFHGTLKYLVLGAVIFFIILIEVSSLDSMVVLTASDVPDLMPGHLGLRAVKIIHIHHCRPFSVLADSFLV